MRSRLCQPDMSESRTNAFGTTPVEKRRSSSAEDLNWHNSSLFTDGAGAGAYSEEAFRYLLAIERKRAARSGRPFFLLLVDFRRGARGPASMEVAVSSQVFAALSAALRDTDVSGWYREGRTAGAILAQLSDGSGDNVSEIVGQRVRTELSSRLPRSVIDRLQMRMFQIPRESRG